MIEEKTIKGVQIISYVYSVDFLVRLKKTGTASKWRNKGKERPLEEEMKFCFSLILEGDSCFLALIGKRVLVTLARG